ncbi:unnamed protein product [Paramecium pentaurelia]|uniref:Uncharacterized protein n=1 Tax=Paramecium pentaurelia TaxID=43138 RepID=A0A8S1V8F8_9CILI|nr:unnamed protein product [Paramecium pentaurelia]
MSIKFDGSQIGIEINPISHNYSITVAQIYLYTQQYLQKNQLDISMIYLTLDGQTILNPQDNSPINFQPESTVFILQSQPTFQIFFEKNQILQSQLQNMPIVDVLNYLLQQGQIKGQNFQVDFYELNYQPLYINVDISQNLYNYINCNQYVIINITAIQQESQKIDSNQKVASLKQNVGANELLQSLILLKNVSLLIDPNGQFVVYKFHFPTLVSGYLQKSQGKDQSNFSQFSSNDCDWIKKNDVEYCSFDDYGFAVRWQGRTISSVKIKQQ